MEMRKIGPVKVPGSNPAHTLCSCGRVATRVHTDTQTGIQCNACSDCYDIESCREEGFAETGEYYSDEEVIQILESKGWERCPELVKMGNQPANVSTEVAIRIIETKPAVVNFNYQEISDHLDSVLEKYRGLVFSDSDVAECKKTIAELRKGQKSLDEFRKATKKQLTESVTNFEFQCKVLYEKFAGIIQPLTAQQDQFELDRRELKRVEIQSIIDSLIADRLLSEKYAVQLIILEEYFNKGKAIKAIAKDLAALADTLSVQEDKEAQDIDLIKTKVQLANAQYQLIENALFPEPYLRLLVYNKPISEIDLLITSDAQQINEREKKAAEARAAKAAEIPKAIGVISSPAPTQIPSAGSSVSEDVPPERSTITATYEVTGTDEQLSELEAYLAEFTEANNFSWRIIEKSLDVDPDDDDFMN
ncbi:MAG: DUF1351 domain-containing protein [Desulfitobacteriaceae bacterium]